MGYGSVYEHIGEMKKRNPTTATAGLPLRVGLEALAGAARALIK